MHLFVAQSCRWVVVTLALAGLPVSARSQAAAPHQQHPVPEGAADANAQMSSDDPFMAQAHIALSPARPRSAADSARAAQLLLVLRQALKPFADVSVAEREGYQIFAPDVPGQRVYHFTNYAYALASEGSFDPSKPSSLLYRKARSGSFTLVGAMYTASADLPLDSLDERVPLSVARWHRHINFCIPPRGQRARWKETQDGHPIFGPQGVAAREACEAAGGRFVEQVFGWMVHVMPFDSDDPYVAFQGSHAHMH